MNIKIGDYIKYRDSGYKKDMFGWIDKIDEKIDYIEIQCDDSWKGARGTCCKISDVKKIHPSKYALVDDRKNMMRGRDW